MTPNWFAVFTLIFWPVVAICLYRLRPVVQATIWTILGAQLLLPVGTFFKFAMIPQLDKNSISTLCAVVGCMLVTGRGLRIWMKFGPAEVLILLFVLGPLVTSLLNDDPIYVGASIIPGVGPYDGGSAVLSQFILLLPFLLGRQFFRSPTAVHDVFSALVIAGLAYSLPLLFEIRMSPQLHAWFYGYYPTDFIQQMRDDGGFRPMVFMGHGLIAAFFLMTAVVASTAFWRLGVSISRFKSYVVTPYLGAVLVLCKSGAALIYGLVLVPLVRWAKPQAQSKVAVLLVMLALLYPLLRIVNVFPTDTLVSVSLAVSEARGYSLKFRFDEENQLLERASQRFWFGWGRYGRNRVFVETWTGDAGDASVTDGRWIVTMGQFGILGFLAEFGLLALPVFRAARMLRSPLLFRETVFVAALALIVAVNIVELLPNATLSPWSWLLAGALLGRSESEVVRKIQMKKKIAASTLVEA